MCVAGCGDEPTVLGGASGTVNFGEDALENRRSCGWNIRTNESKVNTIPNSLFKRTTNENTLFRSTVL